MNKEEYSLAPIQTADEARQCAQLIAEEFAQHNPFSVYNRSTAEALFETWFYPTILDALDEKLSFLVRHLPTNELVAATIATDLYLYYQKHRYDPSTPASVKPTVDFFDEMLDQFVRHDFQQPLKSNQVLYVSAGATRSSHAGQGLGGHLRVHLCDYARDQRGFDYAFVHVAHPATERIYLKKLQGQTTSVVQPQTWQWKKKGDGSSCPMQDYQGAPIVNVLVRFDRSK